MSSPLPSSVVLHEGYLWKKGKLRGGYKKRYFRLLGSTLSYSDSAASNARLRGIIDLRQAGQTVSRCPLTCGSRTPSLCKPPLTK